MFFPELYEISVWKHTPQGRQQEVLQAVSKRLGSGFIRRRNYSFNGNTIGLFTHVASGISLHLIPGGAFEMGLTDREIEVLERYQAKVAGTAAADEIGVYLANAHFERPVHSVSIEPMLVAREPVSASLLEKVLQQRLSNERMFADRADVPGHITISEWEKLCKTAAFHPVTGLRLPSEAEWEFFYRAGSSSLFYWGDTIPETFPFEAPTHPFGLRDLGYYVERCQDHWLPDYTQAPANGAAVMLKQTENQEIDEPILYVVRGGAATLAPWQGCEWLSITAAHRSHIAATDDFENQFVIRPVYPLPI
jgi:formylglycine-generating enzyme required for sulfatase activity